MQNKSGLTDVLEVKGFTLIELLVVVLIIGILAAVALPQYKVAVAKARMTQLVTLANSVAQAEERYYLANNEYTTNWTALDIELGCTVTSQQCVNSVGWQLSLYETDPASYEVSAFDSRIAGVTLAFTFDNSSRADLRGRRRCQAAASNDLANLLCKNATHKTKTEGSPAGANRYFF